MKVKIKPCKRYIFPLILIAEKIKNRGIEVRIRNEYDFESVIYPHYAIPKKLVYEVKEWYEGKNKTM